MNIEKSASHLLKIDLQRFADKAEESAVDNGGEGDELEIDLDAFIEDDSEETDDTDSGESEKEDKEPDKKAPPADKGDKGDKAKKDARDIELENLKKALQKERIKSKALKEARTQVTKPTVNDDEVDPADLALFKEVGFEEGAAKLLLKKLKGVSAKPDKSADELRMDIEIDKLKVNPLYTELEDEDVQDAVKAYAKGHGIKAKTAYLELFGEKKFETNRADLTREIEQRILADAKKRDAYGGIDTRDNGVIDAKPKVKVSKDMADMARLLGKTPEEYLSWAGEVSMEKARKMIQAKKKKG